jgi:general secretion pathway protein A
MIDSPGVGFKGFTPAVFGRAAAQKFGAATGISVKQTSERYRNPQNEPDAFERRTLARFAAGGWERGKGVAEATDLNGKKVLRYLQPLYIAKGCLACHGDPKGELDIAGRAKEGYREGDLRGAISVIVPVGP